jgi:hypothetical protein
MNNLPVRIAPRSRALRRVDAVVEREVAAIHANALVSRAEDKARYTLARERVADVQALTQQGLMAATEIALVEQFCADRAPHASGRLQHIANAGSASIAQAVFDVGQRR